MTKEDAYNLLLLVSRNPEVREQFLTSPLDVVKTGSFNLTEDELNEALQIVATLGRSDEFMQRLYEKLQADFADMAIKLRSSVLRVVCQIEDGFRNVMRMYLVAFYLGVVLIILSALAGLLLRENLLAIAFGGVGVVDIVGYFMYRPAEYLQVSRGKLAQLEMAFMNWVSDAHNWSEVFRQAFKSAQTNDALIDSTSKISAAMLSNVKDTMKAINDYCEPKAH